MRISSTCSSEPLIPPSYITLKVIPVQPAVIPDSFLQRNLIGSFFVLKIEIRSHYYYDVTAFPFLISFRHPTA